MPKSRSVSGSAFGGTINIDTNYAQELVDFWTQKYERVKEELDRIKVRVPRNPTPKVVLCIPRPLAPPSPGHLRYCLFATLE